MTKTEKTSAWILIIITIAVFIWSGAFPRDRFIWFLEVLPVIVGGLILLAIRSSFRFTNLVYCLIFVHVLILMVGGHYTYEFVPLGGWFQSLFDFSRNHYDRLGHFVQGFIPAMIAREVIIRKSPVKKGGWLFFFVVCFCLAFSAAFEVFEWFISITTSEQHGNAFLGMQGDAWDTQWDMFLCLIGSITALLLLSHWHNCQLKRC